MAQIETWFEQDVEKPVNVRYLGGDIFHADNNGNKIGVRLYRAGAPEAITGSVIGYCILATGVSIPVPGTASKNTAWIELPEAVYDVPGNINIVIKNTNEETVTTLAAIVSTVIGLGTVIEDPSQQTINAWEAQINATLTALQNGAVLYSQAQSLSDSQKTQARNNIGANTFAVNVGGDDYKIVIP